MDICTFFRCKYALPILQFMLVMIVCTVRSYRTLRLPATKKEVTWLIVGWLAALVVLPLLMRYGVMPLWRDNLHSYSHFSPDFFINILCSYVRLVLVNVLLVRTLAVWRVKREEKKADVILSKSPLPGSPSPLIEQNFVFVQFVPPPPDAPPGYFDKVNLSF